MVSVPVVSVNEISSVTITFPSMMISSEPIGSMSLLQFSPFDQESSSPAPPSQTPFATGGLGIVAVLTKTSRPVLLNASSTQAKCALFPETATSVSKTTEVSDLMFVGPLKAAPPSLLREAREIPL